MGRSLKLSLLIILVAVLLGGAWTLRSQQSGTREKRPPKPGTLRALVEDPNVGGDIRLPIFFDYALFQNLDALADASDAVIAGWVVSFRSFPCSRDEFVCTQFRMRVTEILSGSIPQDRRGADRIPTAAPGKATTFPGPGPNEIVITQSGGLISMEGRRVVAYVIDEELLQKDHEYILFLHWVPEGEKTVQGSNTYHIMGGPQGAIEVDGEQVRSMVNPRDTEHPIRNQVETLLKANKELLRAHFEERRLVRRP
jgi:hypothetical protein